ncbi:MAG: hypothetical protein ABSD03_10165 [Vulcanimicrobiaceae bacterium]
MRDPRLPEIALLLLIAVLIALGAQPVLHLLAANRLLGTIVLAVALVAAVLAIRRAYDPASPTVRADVTKYVAYCVAAALALVTIDWGPHWAIRACITAAEVAVAFDIVTIVARPRAVGG